MLSVPELVQGKPVISLSLSINPPLKAQFVSLVSPSQSMFIPFGKYPRRVFHISLLYNYIYIYTYTYTYTHTHVHAHISPLWPMQPPVGSSWLTWRYAAAWLPWATTEWNPSCTVKIDRISIRRLADSYGDMPWVIGYFGGAFTR